MKVIAFLPVKGSSERIENKNIKLLDGKPLFLHTLEKLMECDFIDEVYLDSESELIFDIASVTGVQKLIRDPKFATNKTDGHELFYNEARQIQGDIYIQILATSPFIDKNTIKKAIQVLKENTEYDSVVLVKKEKQYKWNDGKPSYNLEKIPNSIDLPDTIVETMGLYVTRAQVALDLKRRIGSKPYLLEAQPIEAIDVNFPEDFDLANHIAAGIREKERTILRNLKYHLSSSMLSDILDDLGIDGVINGFEANLKDSKILGRAKTLKLRELKEGEDFRGIYKALETYETMVPNDIIVVENAASSFAYFGELNANLAIRSGVSGVVVDGKTRDISAVSRLGLPVFSKGYNCRDVRKRATVESFNKEVKINGVSVNCGDLIFGDSDGIIVIPKRVEDLVITKCTQVIKKELMILDAILLGENTDKIVKEFGDF